MILATQTDRHSSVVHKLWEYELVTIELSLNCLRADIGHIDIEVARGDVRRRLRFSQPSEVTMQWQAFQTPFGLCVFDISDRQWEGKRYIVDTLDEDNSHIAFYANELIDLDHSREI